MVFIAACIHSLREGNVFSHVCLSVSLSVGQYGEPAPGPGQTCSLGATSLPNYMPPSTNLAHIFASGRSLPLKGFLVFNYTV